MGMSEFLMAMALTPEVARCMIAHLVEIYVDVYEMFLDAVGPYVQMVEVCDDLAYKSLAIGFPLITLGIVSGALWAQALSGITWIRDVKVLLSFVTWFVYLFLIHYRLIAGWRGKKAAYLAIVGFVGVLLTFLAVNPFGSGFHTFYQ